MTLIGFFHKSNSLLLCVALEYCPMPRNYNNVLNIASEYDQLQMIT
jgi:hypothetical protein